MCRGLTGECVYAPYNFIQCIRNSKLPFRNTKENNSVCVRSLLHTVWRLENNGQNELLYCSRCVTIAHTHLFMFSYLLQIKTASFRSVEEAKWIREWKNNNNNNDNEMNRKKKKTTTLEEKRNNHRQTTQTMCGYVIQMHRYG